MIVCNFFFIYIFTIIIFLGHFFKLNQIFEFLNYNWNIYLDFYYMDKTIFYLKNAFQIPQKGFFFHNFPTMINQNAHDY